MNLRDGNHPLVPTVVSVEKKELLLTLLEGISTRIKLKIQKYIISLYELERGYLHVIYGIS
ncbi:hypothetical protein [Heyndrickxia sporothermodurans]|uniref:hypothetical protein n=1 Tax=Heyndrickxia sporothermodurans TaxID=46224 RepID=UPI000D38DF84|nr:hypothetical protein B5V88_01970 [Heyndrickxia sporothermodurans]PTY87862.1 hypothetical protein B5V91_00530 [Heyndrickxia sporothermodurans]PTY92302.1 hypothetical protein B5V90_03590 [Heyndrickxia sporothermodurans]